MTTFGTWRSRSNLRYVVILTVGGRPRVLLPHPKHSSPHFPLTSTVLRAIALILIGGGCYLDKGVYVVLGQAGTLNW